MRNAVEISVRGDFRQVSQALKAHPNLARRAASRAINRTLLTVRKEAVREAAKVTKVKARLIRKRMHIFQATPETITGGTYFHTQPIPVHSLSYPGQARQLKRGGVRAGRITFKNSFIGTYRRGKRTGKPSVFEYKKGSKTRVVRSMLVIKQHGYILNKVYGRLARPRFLELFHKDLQYRLKRDAGSK